ncbi:PINc/VapC family ATPase [Candidatus Micrarchaeota archaeon]|nr:PINc/VapC family ATPase [Candidatus Micrarchaeota archaeon]
MKSIVPDTGVLIDGRITEMVKRTSEATEIIIANSSLAELEHQANLGKEVGFAGLKEIKKLHELRKTHKLTLHFEGDRPTPYEIEHAQLGAIDANIRKLAKDLKATLMTTDRVQAEVAEAEGLEVEYLKPVVSDVKLSFEKYFKEKNTMSVHLKENCIPQAKIGLPGNFQLMEIDSKNISRDTIEKMVQEAVEISNREENSFIEIDKKGATVIQVGDYRITFTRPPFSEARELTVIRPIAKLSIEDYALSPLLFERLKQKAEGIVIAGPPGSGKSTFVTALAEYYSGQKKIIKTLEQPRDLQVGKSITQYAPLEGSFAQAADILLLVRPDYTVFDEVRKIEDFRTFGDMRLSGIGMIGVVHASKAIDAIQRFLGKIDFGVIPQVIDTIIFLEAGKIVKVYDLRFTVKVPFGMREKDLARPIIEVCDFQTQQPEFQIYKWGEETVVFPLVQEARHARPPHRERFDRGSPRGGRPHPFDRSPRSAPVPSREASGGFVDEYKIMRVLNAELHNFDFEIKGDRLILYVPEHQMKKVLGKRGSNIQQLEHKVGMRIDVQRG